MKKKAGQGFGPDQLALVELPGIEPGAKNGVNCGNAGFDYAKRREPTSIDLRIRQRC
jgi:hypothetical protein